MIRNKQSNDWFMNYKRNKNKKWHQDQRKGSIWSSLNGPIQAIRINNLKGIAEIIEFELTELKKIDK